MLRNANVGDKVVSVLYGRGVVINIDDVEPYPVSIKFESAVHEHEYSGVWQSEQLPSCWLASNAPQWLLGLFPEPEEEKTADKPLFADAKVGDAAFSFKSGWSRIERVDPDGTVKIESGGWMYIDGKRARDSVHPSAWPADKIPAEILALHPRPKRKVTKTKEGVCEFDPVKKRLLYVNNTHTHDIYPFKISDGNVLAKVTITYEVEE